jgi:hypothetical protein
LSPLLADVKSDHRLLIGLGFTIWVFPRVAWQYITAGAKKLMPTASVLPSLDAKMPVSDLDGLTVWHEARLEEEDVENVPNMATSEILDLMLNTRLPPERISDWVDQAILYTHLWADDNAGDKGKEEKVRRATLRAHGTRTATALTEACRLPQVRGDGESLRQSSRATAGARPGRSSMRLR